MKLKILFLFVLAVITFPAREAWTAEDANTLTRPSLRQEFELAKDDKKKVAELISSIEQAGILKKADCPVFVTAYYGALKALEAKYNRNLITKCESLHDGLRLLDKAVAEAPKDMEVRFIRFATLHNLPSFLADKKKRSQDLARVYEMIPKKDFSVVDQATQENIISFLLDSDRLFAEQVAVLRDLRQELRSR